MTDLQTVRDALVAAIPNLRAFAISLTGDPNRANDLVQETLLKAWANRDKFATGSNLKAWLVGTHHGVGAKNVNSYLREFEFRFNNRENPYLFRDCILRLLNAENIEYKDLVKK